MYRIDGGEGPFAAYRAATVKFLDKGYGWWLQWLRDCGEFNPSESTAARMTTERAARCVKDLLQVHSTKTVIPSCWICSTWWTASARRSGGGGNDQALLWPWSRMTAAGIPHGPHACPTDQRHGFGLQTVSKGIALNMVQKWSGHAQLTTTAIYVNAVGDEEQTIAARMW